MSLWAGELVSGPGPFFIRVYFWESRFRLDRIVCSIRMSLSATGVGWETEWCCIAGVVIGSDGFGYAGEGDQRVKIPQVGIVEVEDDVEIGANTTVDRATLGRTLIGRGVKIDNLVQIAHNVVVGENSLIAAQAGIAGSTRIGKDVMLGGRVGIINHLTIGDGARIGPGSGILRSVPPGVMRSSGLDAAPHREWLKVDHAVAAIAEIVERRAKFGEESV